jgi:hypothetical protein
MLLPVFVLNVIVSMRRKSTGRVHVALVTVSIVANMFLERRDLHALRPVRSAVAGHHKDSVRLLQLCDIKTVRETSLICAHPALVHLHPAS